MKPASLLLLFASAAGAQQTIPIRTVKPDGRFAETFASLTAIKQFRTGEIMIDDATARRILLFDNALVRKKVVSDTTGTTSSYGNIPYAFIAPDKMPDYISPIAGAWPDADNHLWILPSTSTEAKDGRLYDVVDRMGQIIERVQLPNGAVVAGFAPGGVVFLMRPEGSAYLLERFRIAR